MLYSDNIKVTSGGIVFMDKHGNKLSLANAKGKIKNRIVNWWLDLKLYFIHFVSDAVPIYFLRKIFFSLAGAKIGRGSTVHMGTRFFEPKGVEIGQDTIVGFRSFLDGRARLKIGSHVDIASEVMIYNSEHDLNDEEFKAVNGNVVIGDYVFVGPRSIILPGVKVGKGAVVAAGAVVTKDVGEYEIVGGIPAKVIGERKNKNLSYRLGRARLFQ